MFYAQPRESCSLLPPEGKYPEQERLSITKGGNLYIIYQEEIEGGSGIKTMTLPWGQENQWVFIGNSQAGRKDGWKQSYLGSSDLFSQISGVLMKVKGLKQLDSYLAGLYSWRSRTNFHSGRNRSQTWSSFFLVRLWERVLLKES